MNRTTPEFECKSMDDVFMDFEGRRAGVIKALTIDFQEFYDDSDPEKEGLCLFAYPDGTWEVAEPDEDVPIDFPEPVQGINFARDGMSTEKWIAFVARHSDAWLLSHTFSLAASINFDKGDRDQLFDIINSLPTVFELLGEPAKKRSMKKPKASTNSSEKIESNYKQSKEADYMCGFCGEFYDSDEFWICCETCERWFHGRCVDTTPERAVTEQYTCQICSTRRKSI